MAQSQQEVARAFTPGAARLAARLAHKPPEPYVTRRWKRDGSTNVMPLSAAVDNLFLMQERPDGEKRMMRAEIKRVLAAGCVLATPLAEFRIVRETPRPIS